jgi:hypothetical protein
MESSFTVGTEIEISNNFLPGQKEVKVNPTLALKMEFLSI